MKRSLLLVSLFWTLTFVAAAQQRESFTPNAELAKLAVLKTDVSEIERAENQWATAVKSSRGSYDTAIAGLREVYENYLLSLSGQLEVFREDAIMTEKLRLEISRVEQVLTQLN